MKKISHKLYLFCLLWIGCSSLLTAEIEQLPSLEPTPKMRTEARYIVHCMEHLHFHSESIQALNMDAFIENYMSDWDYHRLFFTEKDFDRFKSLYGSVMPVYLRQQGNLTPAFDIFHTYRHNVYERIKWINNRLSQDIDFSENKTFTPDRRKAPWPTNQEQANELWDARLKYELLNEILIGTNNKDKPVDLTTAEELEELKQLKKQSFFSERLNEAKEKVYKRYDRLWTSVKDIEASEVEEVFLTSLAHMYDPHSMFFSADSLEDFAMSIRNSLVGIGAILTEEDGYVTIRELLPGGPAEKNNQIKPADKIIGVAQGREGEMIDIIGMKLRKVVKMIRGKEGTEVTLLIQPADADPSARKKVLIVRDQIKLTSNLAKASVYEVPRGNDQVLVGVIDLPTFYGGSESDNTESNTTHDVQELIEKLKTIGVEGMILDLRRNLGGLLTEAISLTGLFIPTGPVLQVKDTIGQTSEYADNNPYIAWDGPLMVLVTRYSASASEIVAGALRNHNRALIVGDVGTHGKGTVQAVFEMDRSIFRPVARPKMGAAKITIQKWYLPDGSSTQSKGVASDIVLPSLNEFLPVKEQDLPRALKWDSIEPLTFDFKRHQYAYKAPVTPKLIEQLNAMSRERQETLEEFDYLNKSIDWFRDKQEQKEYSLNFGKRLAQREEDELFRSELDAEVKFLKKSKYPVEEISLNIAKEKKQPETAESSIELEVDNNAENEPAFDVHLREGLRIMADWVELLEEGARSMSLAQNEEG